MNQEWTSFALANEGEKVLPERILGQDIWSQISDDSLRGIYRIIVRRARAGNTVRFRYRCDSPIYRRTFEMTVHAGPGSVIEFQSDLISEERRPKMNLLADKQPRDGRMVRICSWCQKVAAEDGGWVEVEDAMKTQNYLDHSTLPQLSHGICPECSVRAFGDIGESMDSPT